VIKPVSKGNFEIMSVSLRASNPTSSTPQPIPSLSLLKSSPSKSPTDSPLSLEEAAETLRFHARVPMPSMHSSYHATDASRSHIHKDYSRIVDLEPLDPPELDGTLTSPPPIPNQQTSL
jgi:hypothetical protein